MKSLMIKFKSILKAQIFTVALKKFSENKHLGVKIFFSSDQI